MGAFPGIPAPPALKRISAEGALAFFDPELARLPRGVDLIRVLLDRRYETDPIVLAGSDESRVLPRLLYHHLYPQLAEAVDTGSVVVSDEVRRSIESLAMSLVLRTLALERLVVETAATISSAGVEFLVLKGVATGRLDHAEPVRRQTSDVDILVRRTKLRPAVDALAKSGFVRRGSLVLLDKGEAWESPAGVVDVHIRPHAAGRFLGEQWWTTSEPLPVAGHEFRALSRAGRMAHAASHFSLSYPNHRILTSLLDLIVISRAADRSDRAGAERFLSELGVSDITARITSRAADLMGDANLILGQVGSRPLDMVLRYAYDRPRLDLMAIKLAKTYGMPWREKFGAIRGLVAPSDEFLAKGGYSSRTDRLVTLIRRPRSRSLDDEVGYDDESHLK